MNNLSEFKQSLEARIYAATESNKIFQDEKSEARIQVLSEVLEDFNKIYTYLDIFVDVTLEVTTDESKKAVLEKVKSYIK